MSFFKTAAGAVFVAGLLFACGSSKSTAPKPSSGFCDVARSSLTKCVNTEPQACDQTLATSCANLAAGISPTTATATTSCLESGVCGATLCLSRAPNSAAATAAQTTLATKYCSLCDAAEAGCATTFYDARSKLPGTLVLPYADAVTNAVATQCLADAGGCGTFASCVESTVAATLPTLVPADLATCITNAFQQDTTQATQIDGGPIVASCTPDNCKGCCRDDTCEEGSASSGCGISGNACQTCSKAATCLATGECHEPCSPDNCKGCCDGDNCVPGDTDDKCATNGAACTDCKATNTDFACSGGTCVDASCKATCLTGCCTTNGCQDGTAPDLCGTGGSACVDCGFGRSCDGTHACQLDQTSLWDFYVVSGVVPATKADGSSWDPFGGLPDPYVKATATLGSATSNGQTSVQSDTLTPTWDETPLTGISAQELINNLSVEVWDSDEIDFDDFIGGCKIDISAAAFDGSLQVVKCAASTNTVAVTLSYKLNPHQ